MRETVRSIEFATQTGPAPTAIPVGPRPTWMLRTVGDKPGPGKRTREILDSPLLAIHNESALAAIAVGLTPTVSVISVSPLTGSTFETVLSSLEVIHTCRPDGYSCLRSADAPRDHIDAIRCRVDGPVEIAADEVNSPSRKRDAAARRVGLAWRGESAASRGTGRKGDTENYRQAAAVAIDAHNSAQRHRLEDPRRGLADCEIDRKPADRHRTGDIGS
jgi:hypothetical protein